MQILVFTICVVLFGRSTNGFSVPISMPLLRWIETQGGWVSEKLSVHESPNGGRGLFSKAIVSAGEVLASLPRETLLLSEDAISALPCRAEIEAYFAREAGLPQIERDSIQGAFSIMIFLLEQLGNTSSVFAPYLRDLKAYWTSKTRSRFPLFWPEDIRAELEGTLAFELFAQGEQGVTREYNLVKKVCPGIAAKHSAKQYKQIWSLVNSRILTYPGDPSVPVGGRGHSSQRALLPLFDLANHYLTKPAVRLKLESELQSYLSGSLGRYGIQRVGNTEAHSREMTELSKTQDVVPHQPQLQLWAHREMAAGEELTDVYGLKANDDLLWSWGFTVAWIHNSTCLSTTRLTLRISELPYASTRFSRKRQDDLLRQGVQSRELQFRVDGCMAGLDALIAFLRYWYADASDQQLISACGLEKPHPFGSSKSGQWHLDQHCPLISVSTESVALRLALDAVASRKEEILGGTLADDERRLASDSLVAGRMRDAIIVRRDEKYVLDEIAISLQGKQRSRLGVGEL